MKTSYIEAASGDITLPTMRAQTVATNAPAVKVLSNSAAQASEQYRYVDKPVYEMVKRGFDIVFSIVGLILASPIMLITAIAIKAGDRGPGIPKRMCVGKNHKPYPMYKFRSMVVDADNVDHLLTEDQKAQYFKEVKIDCDPRITKIGKFIRKTSIDELPQLYSVLRGDMSLVGPRPMVEFENCFFKEYADLVLAVSPGITGYWQVYGRNNKKYETGERQQMELFYITNRSLWLDFKLFIGTIGCVLRCNGN